MDLIDIFYKRNANLYNIFNIVFLFNGKIIDNYMNLSLTQIGFQDGSHIEVIDIEKCIEDIIKTYSKEKIILEKNEIIKFLEQGGITGEQRNELEARLNTIIIELAKMK